ncbi:serine hydrolase domain-containing protein [Bradyrhizobium sp. STM 3557]|uniref:serine hydrolase domain-containing protein n=1 Tax=Bradyrhizobium sp. STM 3557 TaxID=578920 RepID=UPI00388DFA91
MNRLRTLLAPLSVLHLLTLGLVTSAAHAEPGSTWPSINPDAADRAAPIIALVENYARQYRPTALMVVQNGRVVASSGDVARKVNVRSVRKSLISALFGIAAAHGQVDITKTLEQLGIDDKAPSLTAQEKQATVRDLLMSRSGVYHYAAYETPEQKLARPERGAHAPSTFWYYNTWDFNALGAIYEQRTGENPFKSFERLIARPIGMEDFTARDGIFIGNGSSHYRAYVFSLSARDLARFGLLFLNEGRWNGAEIIPSQWVTESTRAYSDTDRPDRGYGYLWWVLKPGPWESAQSLRLAMGANTLPSCQRSSSSWSSLSSWAITCVEFEPKTSSISLGKSRHCLASSSLRSFRRSR